ncbi:MAG TPA: alpha/beta hydrolase domain-containing protein [Gemmatimonadales bacterium]|nr:alpha/beta hydrolase domain-containing protein [Gemmatimonadales bacterium]
MRRCVLAVVAVLLGLAGPARAELVRLEVSSRVPMGGASCGAAGPYERVRGRALFAFDPASRANAAIVDLGLAPRNARGRVEAWADIEIERPTDPRRGNGVVLVDVVNRGGILTGRAIDRGGDGFLCRHGYTVVHVGWEWDVPSGPASLGFEAPALGDAITGLVRSDFVPAQGTTTMPLAHGLVPLRAYLPVEPADPADVLTERDSPYGARRTIPRSEWRYAPDGATVERASGFVPGRFYELVYRARNPVVAGTGLLAIRDVASFAKHGRSADLRARAAIAFGVSQTGRLLREYVYAGLNTDERGRKALDGVIADVGGAGMGSFNHRFAQPSRDARAYETFLYPIDRYPFASTRERDPVTGAVDALLDNPAARRNAPLLMQVNNGSEYWSRAASLIHTDPEGTRDVAAHPRERLYAVSSGAHVVRALDQAGRPAVTLAGTPLVRGNPLDRRFLLRALVEAMRLWIAGTEPPASEVPGIGAGTLVAPADVRFPAIPGVAHPREMMVPRRLDFGAGWARGIIEREPPGVGEPFVPRVLQVDSIGNERGGVRSVEIEAPLGTHAGWWMLPGSDSMPWAFNFYGSFVPLPRTEAERAARGDPRPSLERLYPSREAYLQRAGRAVGALVRRRLALAEDSTAIVARADSLWSLVHALP